MLDKHDIDNIVIAVKSALEPEFAELKTDVSGLKSDVNELKTDVSGLKSDVDELKTDVSDLKSDVNELKIGARAIVEKIEELKCMDHAILGEVDRVHEYAASEIARLNKNIEELKQYYRIARAENSNTSLLLQQIEELTRRVEALENKTA